MVRLAAIGAVLAASLCACNNFSDLTTPYLGTWQISSGQDTANCGPGPGTPTPLTGTVIVNSGAAPLQLSVRDTNHGDCVWVLNASRAIATLRSGPECASTTSGSNAVVVPVDYVFTLMSASEATVANSFDWTILDTTCRHVQQESLLLMFSP